jgi:hypothetical protein
MYNEFRFNGKSQGSSRTLIRKCRTTRSTYFVTIQEHSTSTRNYTITWLQNQSAGRKALTHLFRDKSLFLAELDRDRTLGPITKLYASIYEDITDLCEQSGRPNGDSYSLVSVCNLNEFKAGI